MMNNIDDILQNNQKNNSETQNIIHSKAVFLMNKLKERNDVDVQLIKSLDDFLKLIDKVKQNEMNQKVYDIMKSFIRTYYIIFDLIIYFHKYYGIYKYDDKLYSYLLVEHLLMLNDELVLISKSKIMNITLWIQIDKIKYVVKKILANPNINK